MRRYKGWGRVKIAKELGISPNTVGSWIKTKGEIPRLVDEFKDGIYLYRIIDCKRIIEEEKEKGIMPKEKAEEGLKRLDLYYQNAPFLISHYSRNKRIKKEGDDFHLIYS